MRPTPGIVLRGLLKFLAVALAAGAVGGGIGLGLAELSGGDGGDSEAIAPQTANSPRSATETTPARKRTSATTTAITARTTSPPSGTTPTTAQPANVSRTTRVQILSAVLYPASTERGRARDRARVVVRVRVTSRSVDALAAQAPALIVGTDRVRADPRAAANARALLRPLAPGRSVTGELRFETSGSVTRMLTNQPVARLSVAQRTVAVNLRISSSPAPGG